MKLLSAFVALLPLTAAFPRLTPRQAPAVQITNLTAAGPGCEVNTFTSSISNSSADATLGFDAYQSALGPGVDTSEREKHCQIFLSLRFPVGCTFATVSTTYHGFATIGEGAMAAVIPSYNLSPGDLDVGELLPDFLEGPDLVGGDAYERSDEMVAMVEVGDEEHRDVQFVVRSRAFVQANDAGREGLITTDDITVAITDSEAC